MTESMMVSQPTSDSEFDWEPPIGQDHREQFYFGTLPRLDVVPIGLLAGNGSTSGAQATPLSSLIVGALTKAGRDLWPSTPTPTDIVERARARIQRIVDSVGIASDLVGVAARSPVNNHHDDEMQEPIAPAAIDATMDVFGRLAWRPPAVRVAIFPMSDGGLHLQAVGSQRAVSLEIPPQFGAPMKGEYAGDDVYHTQVFGSASAAADFISQSVQ